MEAALFGLVGTLIGSLLTVHFQSAQLRKAQIESLAEFLESIASCLKEMETSLRAATVPTGAGNRLKTILEGYEEVLARAPIPKATQATLTQLHAQIQHCLTSGVAEDDFLRGKILYRPEPARQAALEMMVRVAAYLEGEARKLRAAAA